MKDHVPCKFSDKEFKIIIISIHQQCIKIISRKQESLSLKFDSFRNMAAENVLDF